VSRKTIWGWFQVLSVYGAIEGALWSTGGVRAAWSRIALLLIIVYLIIDQQRPEQLGIGTQGLKRSWWVPPAALGTAAFIVFLGWQVGTLHDLAGPQVPVIHAFGYALWTVIQEFIAQGFFFTRLERLLNSGKRAVIANAILFGAAHWPSVVLVPVTLAGGIILTELFRRYRNILPLAVAHTLVALAIAVAVPNDLHRHMRVGFGYVHYHGGEAHTRRHWVDWRHAHNVEPVLQNTKS
jgi:membrane protease YdiL (CAAX protease family)